MKETFESLFPTINTVTAQGTIKTEPSDFVVIEHNDVKFTGEGEHLWMKVEKVNANTAWVATKIASACKVPARQVGYAGLKDRHAVTQQWFSVQLPKIRELPQIKLKLPDEVRIVESHWHKSKIKTGFLSHNEFKITVRQVKADHSEIERNIENIQTHGVPNYFGPQRFGHDLNNIQQAKDWFLGKIKVNNKKLRGLLISTARSHIFNSIVAERISNNCWQKVIEGDILQLDSSHSWFRAIDATPEEIINRMASFDIHLTAALWGEDEVQSSGQCANMEKQVATRHADYQDGFSTHRVKHDRRAIRTKPSQMSYQWDGNAVLLNFSLQPGSYATSVLREVIKTY